MTRRDALLAAFVAAVWGINFVVSALMLRHLSPFLFTAIRFFLVAVPAIFLVGRPTAGWKPTVLVGLFIGCLQFGLMFWAIRLGLPAGLASLLIQFVTVFTLILGVLVLKERPTRLQLLGVLVGLAGLALIGVARQGSASMLPFFMVLVAALGWAAANVTVRKSGEQSGLAISVWSALVPIVPMLLAAFALDGADGVRAQVTSIDWPMVGGFVFTSWIATLGCFAIWMNLMKRYPTAAVTPWSLCTPPVGMLAGAIVLHELPQPVEWVGAAIVLLGILVASAGGMRLPGRRRTRDRPTPAAVGDPRG
ncbi:EamA family transporter [Cumulibacter manganitolerans]|uniref:EamA family transporter n=1 Tax=Cumulibacter manganitolerans TaxID=1884992 RepID=UPI001297C556|nr:EamA family transporter [Cumulibacter manganitolerans]